MDFGAARLPGRRHPSSSGSSGGGRKSSGGPVRMRGWASSRAGPSLTRVSMRSACAWRPRWKATRTTRGIKHAADAMGSVLPLPVRDRDGGGSHGGVARRAPWQRRHEPGEYPGMDAEGLSSVPAGTCPNVHIVASCEGQLQRGRSSRRNRITDAIAGCNPPHRPKARVVLRCVVNIGNRWTSARGRKVDPSIRRHSECGYLPSHCHICQERRQTSCDRFAAVGFIGQLGKLRRGLGPLSLVVEAIEIALEVELSQSFQASFEFSSGCSSVAWCRGVLSPEFEERSPTAGRCVERLKSRTDLILDGGGEAGWLSAPVALLAPSALNALTTS